ncbi:MAG: anti-sigma factor family protein [Candidatus Promineifilaceae bacterium]
MQSQLHQPKQELIIDYVLGLLDSAETETLERHAASCSACRLAIQQERQIGQSVRSVFAAHPKPTHARLMQLKPAPITRRSTIPQWALGLQRNLAVAMVIVILFMGIGFQQMQHSWSAVASPMPTAYVMTSTATTQPTATHTQVALVPLQSTLTPETTPVPEVHSR